MKKLHAEIVVIGAGPAGLSAAAEAAKTGADVILADENRQAGGQLAKQIHKFFGSETPRAGERGYRIAQELLDEVRAGGVQIYLNSLVYGLFPDKSMGPIRNGESCMLTAERIILAAGAKENYLAFPGSTLPGVMGAGAAQTMANLNRVLPGKRIVMLGSGNVGLIVSYQLMQAGAEIAALVEGAPRIGGYGVHAAKLRRAGVPFFLSHTISSVEGDGQVERVNLVELDSAWKPVPGTEKTLSADTVCIAAGLNPMTELAWMCGAQFIYLPAFGGHVPVHDAQMQTSVPGLYVAGDVTGVEEASTAMEEGRLAGLSAAASLGYGNADELAARAREIRSRLDALRSGEFGQRRRASKEEQMAAMSGHAEKGVSA